MNRQVIRRVETVVGDWTQRVIRGAVLECGHVVSDEPGDSFDCKRCDSDVAGVEAILALYGTPEWSHLVVRDLTAGQTGEWMAFLAYRVDRESPTQCRLHASCSVTPYTREALNHITSHRGPTRGERGTQ